MFYYTKIIILLNQLAIILSFAVIITALNEIDGIKQLLPQIKKEWANEWLVVDGNSTDGSIEEVKNLGFNLVLQKNKGHGDAIITGINETKSSNIIFWGPDGNHEVDEIPKLIAKIKEGYDQVMVSRFGKTSINLDAGAMDRFGNRMFTFLVNIFFGGHHSDALNLSRVVTRHSMMELKFNAKGLDSTTQMTIRALKKKQKITEIVGNEGKRIGGKRKMRPLHVGLLLSKQIIKEFIFWKV